MCQVHTHTLAIREGTHYLSLFSDRSTQIMCLWRSYFSLFCTCNQTWRVPNIFFESTQFFFSCDVGRNHIFSPSVSSFPIQTGYVSQRLQIARLVSWFTFSIYAMADSFPLDKSGLSFCFLDVGRPLHLCDVFLCGLLLKWNATCVDCLR